MTFPLAEASGLSFLFYLVVGAFWLFGNLMQQKQAKRKAEEMKRIREAREAEERRTGKKAVEENQPPPRKSDLEEFLAQLAGNTPRPAAPKPPPPPPPIPRRQFVDEIKFDGPSPIATPPPTTAKPVKVSAALRWESAIGDLDMAASFKQISEMKEAVEMINGGIDQQLQQDALKNVRSMMIDLSSSSVAVPVVPLKTIRAIRTETPHLDLKKRKTFKKALVAAVILETPKALREDPFQGTL